MVVMSAQARATPDESSVLDTIASWSAKPDTSARSVLVTIFGDTVLPVSQDVWMSQLFQLTESFGFSDRLVRTSMFRLAGEGWLTNERVGRQSRYTLTDLAVAESTRANHRIYEVTAADWSGSWTLVLLDHSGLSTEEQATMSEHLTWNGFVRLGRGLLGSPTISANEVDELCSLLEPTSRVPVATAQFEDLEQLVDDGFFSTGFNTPAMASVYEDFVHFYEPLIGDEDIGEPMVAFTLRTMLVHDIRRIRLRYPDVPAQLLPPDWVGDRADHVASELYPRLSASAAPALGHIFEVDYPSVLPGRFGS